HGGDKIVWLKLTRYRVKRRSKVIISKSYKPISTHPKLCYVVPVKMKRETNLQSANGIVIAQGLYVNGALNTGDINPVIDRPVRVVAVAPDVAVSIGASVESESV